MLNVKKMKIRYIFYLYNCTTYRGTNILIYSQQRFDLSHIYSMKHSKIKAGSSATCYSKRRVRIT